MKLKNLLVFCLLFAVSDFLIYRFIFDYSISRTLFHVVFMTATMAIGIYFVAPYILARLGKRLEKTLPKLQLLSNENLVLDAPANHMRGVEGVGGRLTLTDQRLVFVSHKFNIQNHREELNVATIDSVRPHSKFSKGIVLTTKENVQHTFIVDSREQWIAVLSSQKS